MDKAPWKVMVVVTILVAIIGCVATIAAAFIGILPEIIRSTPATAAAMDTPTAPMPVPTASPAGAPQPVPANTAEVQPVYTPPPTLTPSHIPNTSVSTSTRTRIPVNTPTNILPTPTTGSTAGWPILAGASKVSGDSYTLIINVSYAGSFDPRYSVSAIGLRTEGETHNGNGGQNDSSKPYIDPNQSNVKVKISIDGNLWCKNGSFTIDQVEVYLWVWIGGKRQSSPTTVFPIAHTWCS